MIVLDSSFLIGFYNASDVHHHAASALMDRLLAGTWGTGLLLEYVFVEVVTVLRIRRNLPIAASIGGILLEAQELEFVPCSDLFSDALKIFRGQGSAALSFVDAALAHVAQQRAGGLILTFDQGLSKFPGIHVPS